MSEKHRNVSLLTAPVTLEVYSDYVCPFCWLAKPGLDELLASDAAITVAWKAFELRPDPVPTLDPRGEYLERVWRQSVYPMARQMNVPIQLPPVQPRSRLAHEAAKWAQTQDRFDAFNTSVFQAFFERGEDIGEVDVLVGLADTLNLNSLALRTALENRTFEAAVLADEYQAEQRGISGVPAFVAGGAALSGAHPVESLRELIAWARSSGGSGG